MASRHITPYAKAYSFGTDGSAALAGSPATSPRPLERPRYQRRHAAGLRLPLWVVLLSTAGLVFAMAFGLLHLRAEAASLSKQIDASKVEVARTQELIDTLEVRIAEAGDATRIQSIALNRLGMQMPDASQVITVYLPSDEAPVSDITVQKTPQENRSLFSLLLGLIGG
ncbi:MAG: hypothetical protein UFE80_00595 [Christensenellales bacterium]|uniref:Cell division protein FtsL n=1 Tax=Candidatus Avichristensenella intestinipullorum TaxID=2840693 RepID=A0A9D1CIL1_9FIRM|nr:hypothetical protein [Christensenellales bacterium]HIQ62797.1 hypothetical protein [Candidatus Avichristensenella intestinipullorum]